MEIWADFALASDVLQPLAKVTQCSTNTTLPLTVAAIVTPGLRISECCYCCNAIPHHLSATLDTERWQYLLLHIYRAICADNFVSPPEQPIGIVLSKNWKCLSSWRKTWESGILGLAQFSPYSSLLRRLHPQLFGDFPFGVATAWQSVSCNR